MNFPVRYGDGWGMMGNWSGFSNLYLALNLITWILIIAILVAILRWLWKKGGK